MTLSILKRYERVFKNLGYVSISFVFINALGYVFHAVLSRKIGPVAYGEFSILYAFMFALSRPINVLSTAVARIGVITKIKGLSLQEMKAFCKRMGLYSGLVMASLPIIAYPLLKEWLKVGGFSLYGTIALTTMLWTWVAIQRGLLMSREAFGIISLAGALESLCKVVAGITLILLGLATFGALIAFSIGALIAIFILTKGLKDFLEPSNANVGSQGENRELFRTVFYVFLLSAPVGFFIEMDVLLAKRFFSPEFAGIYASMALLGKGVLLFTTVFSGVLYPRLVAFKFTSQALKDLIFGICLTIGMFFIAFIIFSFLSNKIILLFFGAKFIEGSYLLSNYTLCILPLAIHLQVANYICAVGKGREAMWLWFTAIAYYITLELSSKNVNTYMVSIFISHLLFFVVGLLFAYRKIVKANNL